MDYQGRTEVFAHTRIYPSLTLTFYETLDHKSLMFFEDWQEYITEDGTNQSDPTHYYRMRFPKTINVILFTLQNLKKEL